MTQQSSALTLFGLLMFTLSSGIISSSPLSLQTSTAAFAQTPPSSSSLADEIIDETTTSVQDSSSDDNVLEDSNEFGDEDAAIEQQNTAEQDAANVGAQDEDAAQELEQEQDAANTNVDSNVQVGEQQEQLPPTPPPPPPDEEPPGEEPPAAELLECPAGFTFNPDTDLCEQFQTASPCPPGQTFIPDTLACLDEETGRISFAEEHCAKLGLTLNRGTNLCEGTVTRPPT